MDKRTIKSLEDYEEQIELYDTINRSVSTLAHLPPFDLLLVGLLVLIRISVLLRRVHLNNYFLYLCCFDVIAFCVLVDLFFLVLMEIILCKYSKYFNRMEVLLVNRGYAVGFQYGISSASSKP